MISLRVWYINIYINQSGIDAAYPSIVKEDKRAVTFYYAEVEIFWRWIDRYIDRERDPYMCNRK